MEEFVRVASVDEIPEGTVKAFEIGGEPVAVVHCEGGEFRAIEDVCSHADVALSEGEIEGCTIECWLHGSRFDLRTGKPTGLPATEPVPVFPVRIENGEIFVSLTVDIDSAQESAL
jgi:3-phenylpropionate/trans-cinnamate dioxygenase ferredoxin subunit